MPALRPMKPPWPRTRTPPISAARPRTRPWRWATRKKPWPGPAARGDETRQRQVPCASWGASLGCASDTAGAQAAFEKALKLDPDSSEAILALGSLLATCSGEGRASFWTRFIAENPEEAADAHYQLAKLDFDAGRCRVRQAAI